MDPPTHPNEVKVGLCDVRVHRNIHSVPTSSEYGDGAVEAGGVRRLLCGDKRGVYAGEGRPVKVQRHAAVRAARAHQIERCGPH